MGLGGLSKQEFPSPDFRPKSCCFIYGPSTNQDSRGRRGHRGRGLGEVTQRWGMEEEDTEVSLAERNPEVDLGERTQK